MKKNKSLGIIYIILSAFCFAVMNLFVRLSGDLPAIEKSFFRNLVAVLVAFLLLKKNHVPIYVSKKNLPGILIRSIAGTVGIWCNFYALGKIDLADASILNKLSPFFVLLFSIIILKESLTVFQGSCVLLAFIGAMCVIKPGLASLASGGLASWIGALGGLAAGLAYTYVRKLGENGVPGAVIVFFFSAFSCLASLPYIALYYQPASWSQIGLLLLAGVSAAGGQFAITAAYTHSPAREISIYDYSQIIFATLLGFIVLGEVPDKLSFLGYAIIIAASLILFLYNNGKIGHLKKVEN
jgi:drug/metabolite transporter (DMT)-like permease